jgi:ABC-type glycerol-3-phosphate transport system substrate-binding protein
MKMKILAILLAAVLLAALGGCGNGSSLSGKYTLTDLVVDDESYFTEEMMEAYSGTYMEFLSGGKMTYTMYGETAEGTFQLDGDAITVTVDGESLSGKVESGKITLNSPDGTSMIYEK